MNIYRFSSLQSQYWTSFFTFASISKVATITSISKIIVFLLITLITFNSSARTVVLAYISQRAGSNRNSSHYMRRGNFIRRSILQMKSTALSSSSKGSISTLQGLSFDNRNINVLPIDQEKKNYIRQVKNAIFSLVEPTPVSEPSLIAKSNAALELLGLNADAVSDEELSEYFGGNDVIPGSRPAAHCYCGHQFGSFAGQLGDGATMYLGEVINPETKERWELQLKGAGKTPYSRSADGRKVLRSSVREFLCSEAMHYLGVPTTRSASCVTSASTVMRDPMYDGNAIHEPCTIITRIAPNFFRFGSFEIFKDRPPGSNGNHRVGPSAGNISMKKQLLDHMLLYFPHIVTKHSSSEVNSENIVNGNVAMYEEFYEEVVKRTAELCARWQAVGFVHGVLNTDNMSIMGLTIDYGPYGFMEQYDPDYVPNGSDGSARYSYQKQPEMCLWNLEKFAEALDPLLPKDVSMHILSETYWDYYEKYYTELFSAKFGFTFMGDLEKELLSDFFTTMTETMTDFTDAFVALTEYNERLLTSSENDDKVDEELLSRLLSRSATPDSVVQSLKRKIRIHRLNMHPEQIQQIWMLLEQAPPEQVSEMFNGAPVEAIREEISGEKRKLDMLIMASQDIKKYEMTSPATKKEKDHELWKSWCSKYIEHQKMTHRKIRASGEDIQNQIIDHMRNNNPTVVLRNWLAQDAIQQAEARYQKTDSMKTNLSEVEAYAGVRTLLKMLSDPYNPKYSTYLMNETKEILSTDEQNTLEENLIQKYTGPSPSWADGLICTCSS